MKTSKKKYLCIMLYACLITSLAINIVCFKSNIENGLNINNYDNAALTFFNETPSAYFCRINDIYPIKGIVKYDGSEDINAIPLPNDLIIHPGVYEVNGIFYNLSNEGLYRFINPRAINQQRIVYKDDLQALLSGICWICTHGNQNDNLKNTELLNRALNDKLFITCGSISGFTCERLKSLGIDCRVVTTLTLQNWNSYDNGHTMIEVYQPDVHKWVVYDLDNNVYFKRNNMLCSLVELTECIELNIPYEIIYLSSDSRIDISNFRDEHGYSYGLISEFMNSNEAFLRSWYARVINVPFVEKNGSYFFFNEDNREKVEQYSPAYKYMNKETFLKTFYGKFAD